jgi:hypothetical protein
LPFHAAEQHSKKQKNDSAERSDFPRRLLIASSTGQFDAVEPSDWLPFLFRFWANKNEQKTKYIISYLE